MISKNKIKEIQSLHNKKGRQKADAFIVEGEKMVDELLSADIKINEVFHVPDWDKQLAKKQFTDVQFHEINQQELKKISTLKTPNKVLAVVQIKKHKPDPQVLSHELCLGIESLQDPGNFGTILRIANWFGIHHVFCSLDTVELYNPKVIQSTMGALFRVRVYRLNLTDFLKSLSDEIPVFGTFISGESVQEIPLTQHGIILFGNESKGISDETARLIKKRITIPAFPQNNQSMESLNVSSAVAITCAEFRRRTTYSK